MSMLLLVVVLRIEMGEDVSRIEERSFEIIIFVF